MTLLLAYARGGWLMPAITLSGAALYASLAFAWLASRRMNRDAGEASHLNIQRLSTTLIPARALIAALPLLGLLGTVGGVSTSMSSIARRGLSTSATAGGIGEALITTQYALLLALPAVLIERMLTRKVRLLRASSVEGELA